MTTPLIPGFHPDPSICRVGESYFLVTSTFEYFPGVPVFTSTDLTSWRQLGSILDRPSQLAVRTGIDGASGGIYAPTIRHHDGRFWMTTTNFDTVRDGHLIVHSESAEGPWSDPVYTAGLVGIDPDLAWDDEGRCYLSWSDVVRGGISQAQIDPETGVVLGEPLEIWRGTGGAHAEGPHLFHRGDWWYLLAAEGGTSTGHMVTVARSRGISGPFESNPANPILTHRSTTHAVQSTGHADIVELVDGSWAMVHLGTRIRGSFPRWHTNGRETFLTGIDWVDDWPVVVEGRFDLPGSAVGFVDDFTGATLHPRWIAPGVDPTSFATPTPSGLGLRAGRTAESIDAVRLLAVRAVDFEWTVAVRAVGDIGVTVRIDDAHQATVQRVGDSVSARVVIGPVTQTLGSREHVAPDAELIVRAVPYEGQPGQRKGPDRIVLGVQTHAGFDELARFDGRYLSTEVAGGFTGRVVGVEALGSDAIVTCLSYSAP